MWIAKLVVRRTSYVTHSARSGVRKSFPQIVLWIPADHNQYTRPAMKK